MEASFSCYSMGISIFYGCVVFGGWGGGGGGADVVVWCVCVAVAFNEKRVS